MASKDIWIFLRQILSALKLLGFYEVRESVRVHTTNVKNTRLMKYISSGQDRMRVVIQTRSKRGARTSQAMLRLSY